MIHEDLTESPIEKMLYDAITEWHKLEGDPGHEVICQKKIGRFRVDFAFECWGRTLLVVECDGHEWHEKTKEQAARDKSRDRELLVERGIPTIRFAGSEIFRDATECAREAMSAAHNMFADLAWIHHLERTLGERNGR